MSIKLDSIEKALADLAAGKMVVLIDDEGRENEGDLVMAAEHMTGVAMNFMIKHARGLVCMPMLHADFMRLRVPMMVAKNTAPRQTAFGVSIEAREGVTTGISAADRATTVRVAACEQSSPSDIVMPGHIFPLCAKDGGVLTRAGHTEGSVDLVRLAGCRPAAVICEIMNDDGTMSRLPDLIEFAAQHQLALISIHDLQDYRIAHEQLIDLAAQATLPINDMGDFSIKAYTSRVDGQEMVVLSKPPVNTGKPPLVRLHSACLTGDIFGSQRCDCGAQLSRAMAQINKEGGYIIYLPQEGRGIGLTNKIKAYALQEQGLDTVEANHKLGFADDLRDYGLAVQILRDLGISDLRLLTNNPRKVEGLQRYGIDVSLRVPLQIEPQHSNVRYLQTKREKLGHWVSEALAKGRCSETLPLGTPSRNEE